MSESLRNLTEDILVKKDVGLPELDKDTQVFQATAERKFLDAPKFDCHHVDHELLSAYSRIRSTASDIVEQTKTLYGSAYGTHFEKELLTAAKINRGPQGLFKSSRLHMDMLLRCDETVTPGDYLDYSQHAAY
uniref:Mitochondrial intermediate peptidase n=1 Tax=Syphacia muris TaxID=451379 RepID=A0A0N5AQI0_9BILA